MLFKIVNDFPHEILKEVEPPFISLYQPTHRYRPDNKQDVIRFKNLMRKIEDSLKAQYAKDEVEDILKPFYDLAEDALFWNQTLDGLVILATKNGGVIYKLRRPVKELAVVADSFHTKPLIRVFQSADRYQLLGLNRNEFVLYEGNRYGFTEIELEPDTPNTMEEILGEAFAEKYLTYGTYAGADGVGSFHGHGSKKDEVDKSTTSFFRYVDRFVYENYSKPSGLPLILVSLAEHHPRFQDLSHNPFLMKDGIKTAFDALSITELKSVVWEKVEYLYLDRTKKLVDGYEAAKAKSLASDHLEHIAKAAWEKRIATLLIESDKIIPGSVNVQTGELKSGDLEHPEYDDVLDDLAEMVFNSNGEVLVLPKERMPSTTGAAGIFRY